MAASLGKVAAMITKPAKILGSSCRAGSSWAMAATKQEQMEITRRTKMYESFAKQRNIKNKSPPATFKPVDSSAPLSLLFAGCTAFAFGSSSMISYINKSTQDVKPLATIQRILSQKHLPS